MISVYKYKLFRGLKRLRGAISESFFMWSIDTADRLVIN